jgi:hypothetical protein
MDFGHFTVDEGTDPQTGVRTQYIFEGDQVVCKKTYDATPYIKRAQEMRARNEGKGWGDGKEVGVIPPWEYHKIQAIKDDSDREKATKLFFRQNPAFLAYDAYIK